MQLADGIKFLGIFYKKKESKYINISPSLTFPPPTLPVANLVATECEISRFDS